jgi:uncharacterized membrane protein
VGLGLATTLHRSHHDAKELTHMEMMGWMGLGLLVILVALAVLLAGAGYLGGRAGLGRQRRDNAPQQTLERRFAAGEIDGDEYHDRLAALRSTQVGRPGR